MVSTNDDVVSTLKEGFKETHKVLRILNMASSCSKVWFHTPWILEKANLKHLPFVVGKRPIAGEDGDDEVLHEHLLDSADTVIDANRIGHVNCQP